MDPSRADPTAAPARRFLLVLHGGRATTHPVPEVGALVIGRAAECDVAVDDPSLSRRHARLSAAEDGTLTLEDLESQNGTRLRGQALEGGRPIALAVGEIAELGHTAIIIQRGQSLDGTVRAWRHGYFEGRLEEECSRAAREGSEFAVLFCAHDAADSSHVLDRLAPLLRPDDVVGRWGPRALEVLLHQASRADAEELAGRLRARVAAGEALRVGIGAYPADGTSAEALLGAAVEQARGGPEALPESGPLVVGGGVMDRLHGIAERAAAGTICVLLLGETGAGKEVMAARIHRLSRRSAGPFVRLHCAALSETLVESELFGHERGAFTGAVAPKPGLLETADGGTIFLDEIGELPLSVQVKLLRVLEEREVLPVGALKARPIDVRFVAATNRDLEAEVARGAFRQDLYYRIAGITLVIPPLRERTDEIAPLAQVFLDRVTREAALPAATLSPEALTLLRQYAWPGNIRELRNFMERAALLAGGGAILPEHLPLEKMLATVATSSAAPASSDPAPPAAESDAQRQRILDALTECAGNQSEAARKLGISRRTMSIWLDQHNIPRPRKAAPKR